MMTQIAMVMMMEAWLEQRLVVIRRRIGKQLHNLDLRSKLTYSTMSYMQEDLRGNIRACI